MTALLLLGPATPMLFQGQEFAASSPFLYFADLPPELAKLTRAGRAEFLAQFPSLAGAEAQAALPDPTDRLTFERSKLDLGRARAPRARRTPCTSTSCGCGGRTRCSAAQGGGGVDGAVLGPEALALRFFGVGSRPRRSAALPQPGSRSRLPDARRALARAARGDALEPSLVQRGHPLRRRRHARSSIRPTAGSCRATPPSSSDPRDDRSDPPDPVARSRRSRAAPAGDPRVARHERTRRLRVGHGVHADDAAVPRTPDRRPPGAARPDEHAEPPARAARPAGRERGHHDRWLGGHRSRQAR